MEGPLSNKLETYITEINESKVRKLKQIIVKLIKE